MTSDPVLSWLLQGPPWLRRRVLIDLMGEDPESDEVEQLRLDGLADPPVARWLGELQDWPGPPLKGHKTLNLLIHKLAFLSVIGLRYQDDAAENLVSAILESASPEGPFRIPVVIPKAFGGSGDVEPAWILTDAPVIVGALGDMGLSDHPLVIKAAEYLSGLVRDNGWPCAADPVLGRFRGPGRKEHPCPYANLVMLRMLSSFPSLRNSPGIEKGIDALLELWDRRHEWRPYMFGMGSDFLKLKAPFVWFDILHVLDVLSRYPVARRTAGYRELYDLAAARADTDGRFTPGSVYRPASDFDFGSKKAPSRWITFIMRRLTEPEAPR